MAVQIGMNGFGRIGRYLLRVLAKKQEEGDSSVYMGVINARADNASLAHLLKYDSCHGHFPYPVSYDDNGLLVNGQPIRVTRFGTAKWDWENLGVDIAIETTGTIKDKAGLAQHMDCGAKKVIISAPASDADAMVVMGVNQNSYSPGTDHIISAASCTTNCLAPAIKVLHETFGVEHGLMTTIHSYTMSQRLLDGSHKDPRRSRSAALSMIPTSTGAARAIGKVIPDLAGKLDGMAVRVPTPNVSLVDATLVLAKSTTREEVNAALKAAASSTLRENMGYSEEPLVSIDYMGSTYGGVIDALSTTVMNGNLLKLIIWYDNEAGFTNQLDRLIRLVAKDL